VPAFTLEIAFRVKPTSRDRVLSPNDGEIPVTLNSTRHARHRDHRPSGGFGRYHFAFQVLRFDNVLADCALSKFCIKPSIDVTIITTRTL
jgi:hypothetical protein